MERFCGSVALQVQKKILVSEELVFFSEACRVERFCGGAALQILHTTPPVPA